MGYKGAGILLYRKSKTGGYNVILFKRNNAPDKGKYSITGGQMDHGYTEGFEKNAERETLEEVGIRISIPEGCPYVVTRIPFFFMWKTYFIPYEGTPDVGRFRHSEIAGFLEMSLEEALQRKDLAFPMSRTLKALRRRIRKGII